MDKDELDEFVKELLVKDKIIFDYLKKCEDNEYWLERDLEDDEEYWDEQEDEEEEDE